MTCQLRDGQVAGANIRQVGNIQDIRIGKSCHVDKYVGRQVNTKYRTTDLLARRLGVNPVFGAAILYNKGATESLVRG